MSSTVVDPCKVSTSVRKSQIENFARMMGSINAQFLSQTLQQSTYTFMLSTDCAGSLITHVKAGIVLDEYILRGQTREAEIAAAIYAGSRKSVADDYPWLQDEHLTREFMQTCLWSVPRNSDGTVFTTINREDLAMLKLLQDPKYHIQPPELVRNWAAQYTDAVPLKCDRYFYPEMTIFLFIIIIVFIVMTCVCVVIGLAWKNIRVKH